MESRHTSSTAELEKQIAVLKDENARLQRLATSSQQAAAHSTTRPSDRDDERYERQMLLDDFGIDGQTKLRDSNVLVVGAGGLGSPVLMYLTSMGVESIGVVDHDFVERSNLHRQIIYDDTSIGRLKVDVARHRLKAQSPHLQLKSYPTRLTRENALDIISDGYDLVIDATDNPPSRYLINDACVATDTPLVSGSAIGIEGQVTVFTYNRSKCPDSIPSSGCYRCLYPVSTATAARPKTCTESGVMGVVPGIIGSLQAMEAVKVLSGMGKPLVGVQCFYDGYDGSFRRLKLPPRRKSCIACGDNKLSFSALQESASMSFCQGESSTSADALAPENRISALGFHRYVLENSPNNDYELIDVRPEAQYRSKHFASAKNIPLPHLLRASSVDSLGIHNENDSEDQKRPVFVLCQRGVASVRATKWLLEHGMTNVKNVEGGYAACAAWSSGFLSE